jgi:hypothetical protein
MTSCVFFFLPVIVILTIFKNNSRINWHYWEILLAPAHIIRTQKRYRTELELKPRSSRGQEAKQAKLNRRNTCSARIRASQSLLVCQVHGRKLARKAVACVVLDPLFQRSACISTIGVGALPACCDANSCLTRLAAASNFAVQSEGGKLGCRCLACVERMMRTDRGRGNRDAASGPTGGKRSSTLLPLYEMDGGARVSRPAVPASNAGGSRLLLVCVTLRNLVVVVSARWSDIQISG